jgi:hypothetical protein
MATTTEHDRELDEKESTASEAAPLRFSQVQSNPDELKNGSEVIDQSGDQEARDVERSQDDPAGEPPSDQQVQRVQSSGEDYSVLTVAQKRLVVMTASLASLFSPMATAIYCESSTLWPKGRTDFNRSITRYNI